MFEAGSLIYRIQTVGAGIFRTEMQEADRTAKKASESIKDTAKSTKELGDQSRLTRPRLHEITGELRGMSQEAQQASREVGGTLVAIGAGVVAMAGLTVKAAKDWETAWTGVTKTVEGTPAELKAVEVGLRDMAGELPAAHSEIAAVAEAAGQLGVQTPNVVAFTRTMIDLGETTNLAAGSAATELARFMNVMGTAQEDVGRLGSAVVELGNNYATTEAEIVAMAQRLSGAARVVGLTEGETLGLAAALSSVGIEAEAGGSAISKVMVEIASQVETGGDKLDTFASVAGVSAERFSQHWRSDPGAALALFVAGLSEMESQGKSTFGVLEELGITEVRMRDALLRSSSASDQFTASMKTGNDAWAENNALQAEAEKRYDTAAAKMDVAKNEVVDMAIELGEHLLPAVVAVVEGIGDFANMVSDLPEPIQGAISIGGALIGMITLAGGAALIAIPKVVAFRQSVSTLTATMPKATGAVRGFATFMGGPWGVALAAGVIALSLLNDWFESNKASAEQMAASVKSSASSAEDMFDVFNKGTLVKTNEDLSRLQDLLDQLGDGPNEWSTFWSGTPINNLRSTVGQFGETLAEVASTDLPAAQTAFNKWAAETDGSEQSLWRLLQAMPEFKDSLIVTATELGTYAEGMDEAEKKQALLDLATGRGVEQTKSAADAYLEAADATSELEQDLNSLLETLDEANNKNQDAITANLDYRDALAEVDETIRLAKEGTEGYSLGLDENTQTGRDNMRMLTDIAAEARDAAQAQFEVDGSVEGLRQRLEDSRQALIDRATDLGATRQQAEDLADEILAMPTEHEFEVIAHTADAHKALNDLKSSLEKFQGSSYSANITAYVRQIDQQAAGSVRTAADGYAEPMSHQSAQMRRGGSYVLWAEDETEGESFIPHAKSKRSRSEQLLAETAAIFGGTYIPANVGVRAMADGETSSERASTTTSSDRSAPTELSDETIRKLAEALKRGNRRDDWRGDA